jgi:orotate phosphoribosyltransferase
MSQTILAFAGACRGHFALESGHHADLWFDLETLCQRPALVRPFAAQLAARLARHEIEIVCGPLVEGAYISLMVAEDLNVEFVYAERFADPQRSTMFPVEYRLPNTLRSLVQGRRVAIVNDVISAGSAVRGTFEDLRALGAQVVAIAALLVLGDAFPPFAAQHAVALDALEQSPYELWTPEQCPLCAAGVPLERRGD